MRHAFKYAIIAACTLASSLGAQQPVELAPNAPQDKPLSVAECQWRAAMKAMAPYVAQARASYPAARERFAAGLPPRHIMFVTTRLRDPQGREEQVFVAVDSIRGSHIVGRIWNDITLVSGYRRGQPYTLADSSLLDWMVARPDGREEGNIVGKFLDTYQPPADCRAGAARQ